jgi:hypothetical protein
VGWGGWGNSSSKAFGISFADRPKAKRSNTCSTILCLSAAVRRGKKKV